MCVCVCVLLYICIFMASYCKYQLLAPGFDENILISYGESERKEMSTSTDSIARELLAGGVANATASILLNWYVIVVFICVC